MKTLILILVTAIASYSQISVGDEWTAEVITIKTDTMSVEKSFELADKLCQGRMWYWDRKVIFEGKTYFQFGLSRKKRTWIIEGNKMRRATAIHLDGLHAQVPHELRPLKDY
jgi:hypothetical protein